MGQTNNDCRFRIPDDVWPDMWNHVSDAAKKKAKQKWAVEKPKLDNARQLREIFFVEPNDEEFKLTMKAARRKLEVPMPAAMPCKIPIKSSGRTHRSIGKRRTQYACVVDADESTRPRLEGAVRKHHQDHIAEKGMDALSNYNLVHKIIPMPQAMKIPDAKVAVVKEWEKLEKIPAWQLTKVRNKKEVIDGQGDGVSKACRQQAAADSRGSRTCVCANTLSPRGWHM